MPVIIWKGKDEAQRNLTDLLSRGKVVEKWRMKRKTLAP
jgi:hypothetical protein